MQYSQVTPQPTQTRVNYQQLLKHVKVEVPVHVPVPVEVPVYVPYYYDVYINNRQAPTYQEFHQNPYGQAYVNPQQQYQNQYQNALTNPQMKQKPIKYVEAQDSSDESSESEEEVHIYVKDQPATLSNPRNAVYLADQQNLLQVPSTLNVQAPSAAMQKTVQAPFQREPSAQNTESNNPTPLSSNYPQPSGPPRFGALAQTRPANSLYVPTQQAKPKQSAPEKIQSMPIQQASKRVEHLKTDENKPRRSRIIEETVYQEDPRDIPMVSRLQTNNTNQKNREKFKQNYSTVK